MEAIDIIKKSKQTHLDIKIIDLQAAKVNAENQCCVLRGEVNKLQAEVDELKKVLKLADEAMNYLGDILNKHDMVQPEDEAVTKEAFEAMSKIIGKSKP